MVAAALAALFWFRSAAIKLLDELSADDAAQKALDALHRQGRWSGGAALMAGIAAAGQAILIAFPVL